MKKLHFTIIDSDRSDDYYQNYFGVDAIVTRLGRINLVHLDGPSNMDIKLRIKETMMDQTVMECDCPICKDYKDQPLDIVYFDEEIELPEYM